MFKAKKTFKIGAEYYFVGDTVPDDIAAQITTCGNHGLVEGTPSVASESEPVVTPASQQTGLEIDLPEAGKRYQLISKKNPDKPGKIVTVISVTDKAARVEDEEGKTFPVPLGNWNGKLIEEE